MINFPYYGMIEGPFAQEVLGKTFTIIQAKDAQIGDTLVDFQCVNFAHQIPAEITMAKSNGDFVHLKWKGRDGKEGKQYARFCIFGKLKE